MSVSTLLRQAEDAGVTVQIEGDRLRLRGRQVALNEWTQQLSAAKTEILGVLRIEFEEVRDELIAMISAVTDVTPDMIVTALDSRMPGPCVLRALSALRADPVVSFNRASQVWVRGAAWNSEASRAASLRAAQRSNTARSSLDQAIEAMNPPPSEEIIWEAIRLLTREGLRDSTTSLEHARSALAEAQRRSVPGMEDGIQVRPEIHLVLRESPS